VLGSRANAENLRLAYFFYDCVSERNIIGHHFSSKRHLHFGIDRGFGSNLVRRFT